MKKSRVAIVRCESYDEQKVYSAIKRGIDLIGGINKIINKGEHILLKPNVLAGVSPEVAATTHPSVFNGIAKLLIENGVIVSYGDSPISEKPEEALTKAGITDVAKRYGIKLGDFEKGKCIDYPEGMVGKKFFLSNACLGADGIISLPKMKTHALTTITGAIKNQFGCIYGLNKVRFHVRIPNPVDFSKMLVDLNKILSMRLFIMDGITAMEGNDPRNGEPVSMNCLIISTDPVAVDSTFCRMVDVKPELVPTVFYGKQAGLGNYSLDDIEYYGDKIETFVRREFNVTRSTVNCDVPRKELPPFVSDILYPIPLIDREKCTRCGECVDVCPIEGKALEFKDFSRTEPPVYNNRKCIRCYCCQEACGHSAIFVRKKF